MARVLVLRPREEALSTADALQRAGHTALVAPVLALATLEQAAPAGHFHLALATSARAIEEAAPAVRDALRAVPLFTVGARTAEVARQAGFTTVQPPAETARALADHVIAAASPERLAYLAGEPRKPTLEEALTLGGFTVDVVPVYAMRPVPRLPDQAGRALAAGAVDAALHFSRESALAFTRLVAAAGLMEPAREVRHVCLSEDVMQGLKILRPYDFRIAHRPNAAALLAALV